MKFIKIVFLFFLMCSTTSHSQTIPIYKTNQKLTVDGDLSDWKTPFSGPFVIHNSAEKASQNTMVSF
ncbi:MAG: hypothetical protein RSD71_15780, partial [Flavobacterium sp.]